jgi:hypothetical protein
LGGNFGIATLGGPPDADAVENDIKPRGDSRSEESNCSGRKLARSGANKSVGDEQRGGTQMAEG